MKSVEKCKLTSELLSSSKELMCERSVTRKTEFSCKHIWAKEDLNAVEVLLEIYQIDKYPSESKYLRLSCLCKLRVHQDHAILREVILQVGGRQLWCFNPELFELATRLAHPVKSLEKEIFYMSLLLRYICSPGEQGIETSWRQSSVDSKYPSDLSKIWTCSSKDNIALKFPETLLPSL